MKKLTIIALFVSTLVFVSNVHAQDEGRFGVKAGLNLANMSIGDDADNSMRTGLHAGFMAKVPLTEKVALQPELIYSRKGTDIKYDADFLGIDLAEGETNVRFDYIDIPIYLVFNPVENFNVHAGPYLGLLLGAQVDTQAEILEGIDINDEDDIDIDHFNSTEFGLSGGIAFEFDRVSLGVNYNWGLSQIAKDDDVSETLIGDAKKTGSFRFILDSCSDFKELRYAFDFCTTLLFLLALINESKSLAQENSFGLRGGINFSDLSNVDADKQQLGIGWNAGFRADIKLTKKVSILSEILYSRKGSVINFNYDFLGEQIAKGETILAFDYIDIPVYLAYHPTNKLSIYAGPYIGLMLEAKVDTQVEILNILNIESDEDIDLEYFNSKDFGVSAGISWKYNFIRLGASYFYGLAKISNDDDVSKSLIGDAKNRVFEVYVGVMF